ncbi:MAG: hypothetical protein WCB27_23635 [Thermoguttaceae bacterium]|jgi:hypothetical protein
MLDEVLDWHRGVVDALLDQRRSVQDAIRASATFAARFVGMTEADVDVYYDAQRRELDRLTMLNLVASAEATIKVDYFRRVEGKLKDPLARAYRDWYETLSPQEQRRPNFDADGILDVLRKAHVMDNHIIGQYRECLRARHWIGHGRYWAKPVEVDRLDPDEVFNRTSALLQAMPR